jgi:hypothetical protein
VNRRAADRPLNDRRRRLPRDRSGAADGPPLAAAVGRPVDRGGQQTSEPGTQAQGRLDPVGTLAGI